MFSAYFRLEQLSDSVKTLNRIKVGAKVPRYDCTALAGYYKPLDALKNAKGQLFFYLSETRGIINSSDQRRTDNFLQASKDSFNFSSIFMLDYTASPLIGYGNANGNRTFGKVGKTNPFFECKNDGYLFVISQDWQQIEVLVIPDGKHTIYGNAKELADGRYFEALESMRKTAKPIYNYITKAKTELHI